MIKLNINVSKIPKERIVAGEKGKYIDLVLHENKSGVDQYGNAGFVAMDVSKAEREAGTRGAIVGNFKVLMAKGAQQPPSSKPDESDGDIWS